MSFTSVEVTLASVAGAHGLQHRPAKLSVSTNLAIVLCNTSRQQRRHVCYKTLHFHPQVLSSYSEPTTPQQSTILSNLPSLHNGRILRGIRHVRAPRNGLSSPATQGHDDPPTRLLHLAPNHHRLTRLPGTTLPPAQSSRRITHRSNRLRTNPSVSVRILEEDFHKSVVRMEPFHSHKPVVRMEPFLRPTGRCRGRRQLGQLEQSHPNTRAAPRVRL